MRKCEHCGKAITEKEMCDCGTWDITCKACCKAIQKRALEKDIGASKGVSA